MYYPVLPGITSDGFIDFLLILVTNYKPLQSLIKKQIKNQKSQLKRKIIIDRSDIPKIDCKISASEMFSQRQWELIDT